MGPVEKIFPWKLFTNKSNPVQRHRSRTAVELRLAYKNKINFFFFSFQRETTRPLISSLFARNQLPRHVMCCGGARWYTYKIYFVFRPFGERWVVKRQRGLLGRAFSVELRPPTNERKSALGSDAIRKLNFFFHGKANKNSFENSPPPTTVTTPPKATRWS